MSRHRKFADSRLGALVAAVHAEAVAGYPQGRPFLDSVEAAMAVVGSPCPPSWRATVGDLP
jgi:hypothetical protein